MRNLKQKIENKLFSSERVLIFQKNTLIKGCIFTDGESPLKNTKDIDIIDTIFKYKYPLWYSKSVVVKNTTFEEMARSGLWYTDETLIEDCIIHCPKTFRRSKKIKIINTNFLKAEETMWNCSDIELNNCQIYGDYFCMNSDNIKADNVIINGNYAFDGCENLSIKNSVLNSKDAFWNCKNVTVENCKIIGEYLSWNTENITFINCEISSHQGLCYVKNLVMKNCSLDRESDRVFEFCKNVDIQLNSSITSIQCPIDGGVIDCRNIKKVIDFDLPGTDVQLKQYFKSLDNL